MMPRDLGLVADSQASDSDADSSPRRCGREHRPYAACVPCGIPNSWAGFARVVVSDPFMPAAPVLEQLSIPVATVADLLRSAPTDPVDTDDDDLALMQLTSGSTGSPKAVRITHANVVANAEAMIVGCDFDIDTDVIISWLPCFHDMGMTGYLTVPMYFGAELVKVTPMDFLSDTLLWAKLIDKYRGTMTAAPNFAYNLFAKRLRRQAKPGEFDLSSLRWALSGAEQVDPLDVKDLCDAGAPFGLRPESIIPAYGMAETTVAVSFSECGGGMVVGGEDGAMRLGTRRRHHRGARRSRHQRLHHRGGLHQRAGRPWLVRHRRPGISHRNRQRGGVRTPQGRHHHRRLLCRGCLARLRAAVPGSPHLAGGSRSGGVMPTTLHHRWSFGEQAQPSPFPAAATVADRPWIPPAFLALLGEG